MGGTNIGHDGDAHTGETGDETTGGADEKADACGKIFKVTNCGEQKEGDSGNGLELAVEICGGSFLDSSGDFPHAVVSVRLTLDPHNEAPGSGQAN